MAQTLGFIGLGAMGGPMARNLLDAGCELVVFDIEDERVQARVAEEARAAASAKAVVGAAEVVFTSLPYSHTFVEVAEAELIPHAREGQVFVDLGTMAPPETRRLAEQFRAKGAHLLDVPVSGGPSGAEAGTLRMFAGGDRDVFERVLPLLHVLGEPDHVVYCGPSGAGQAVKGVNQLAMGLSNAAYLECAALAKLAGADLEAVRRGVGGETGWRLRLRNVIEQVMAGAGENVGVKYGQLAYYLAEGREGGFDLPLTRALHEFCEGAEKRVIEVNRPSPAFWHELTKGRRAEEGER